MAITGPSELPYILKVDSDPLKKYALSQLGYPVVEVEVDESQMETVLRTTGNFIAHYFSKEQKFGVFYTQPLVSEYDLPSDAYWIQEIAWDPVTTMVDKIFGAEAFLFCFGPGTKILRSDDEMTLIEDWQEDYKAKTPFGDKKVNIEKHEEDQGLLGITHERGKLLVTPNHPVKTIDGDLVNGWYPASELQIDDEIVVAWPAEGSRVQSIEHTSGPTHSITIPGAHCLWVGVDGDPVLVS